MAIKCGFFNSRDRDRLYSAEDMNEPYKGILSNGIITGNAEEATIAEPSLKVVQYEGLNIKIKAGRGIFSNKWFLNDSDEVKNVPTNHTNIVHYASVIVRIDNRADYREATFEVKQNEENPAVKYSLDTTPGVNEYRLADITLNPGVVAISDVDITDTRLLDECGVCQGLVKQLSTEQIYLQWQRMFRDWFNDVQIGLKTQATLVTSLANSYETQAATETIIPIGIPQYNKSLDSLQVSINGLDIVEGIDYTIDSNSQITLTKSVYKGAIISFIVLKSIDGSQAETIVQQFQDLQQVVNGISPKVDRLTIDSGWINFTLERGTAIEGLTPAVRRVGNVIYFRGALSGITTTASTTQVTICTLPEEFAPEMEHYFTHVIGGTGSGVGYTTLRFKVNRSRANGGNATIVLNGSTGPINANQTIPIATSFVLG